MAISTRFTKGCTTTILLKKVRVRPVLPEEQDKWNDLISKHHYLGEDNSKGRRICYVAECKGKCVALLSFSAASMQLSGRDNWIGWDNGQRYQRLNFLAQNSRFLIMPDVTTANLATRVMKLCRERLSKDWEEKYKIPLLAVETFVDKSYPGTSYRADNWVRLGETKGFSRDSKGYYIANGSPKSLWVKELRPNAKELLKSEKLPKDLAQYELPPKKELYAKAFTGANLNTLWDSLSSIKDHRGRRGRRHKLANCLAIVVCGTLAGAKGLSECAELAKLLKANQHRALGTWKNSVSKKYVPPSHSALHRVLSGVDPEEFESVFFGWFNKNSEKLPRAMSIDGKSLRANLQDRGEEQHAISLIAHDGSPFLPRASSAIKVKKEKPLKT